MAEFTFYGSDKDSLSIAAAVVRAGDLRIVPDINYQTRRVKYFSRVTDELRRIFAIKKHFYLTGPFSQQPLCLRELRGDRVDQPFFYIDQQTGGPAISLTLASCQKLDERVWHVLPGDLFYPPYFWDDETNTRVSPSEPLKAAFASLVKTLKSQLHKRKLYEKTLWIGEEGLSLLESGDALILVRGMWLNFRGEIVKPNMASGPQTLTIHFLGAEKGDRKRE